MNSVTSTTSELRYATRVSPVVEPTSNLDFKRPLGGRFKRVFDVFLAVIGLINGLPFLIIVAIAVRVSSPGPIFFRHERIGFNGVPFKCTKFRTMHVDATAQLSAHLKANPKARAEFAEYRKLKNDPRIIPFVGDFLRKSSLDELGQLFDVLKGDMSIVGPRPVTREEVLQYGEVRGLYASTRPGITGLWQVSGRNDLSFDQRVDIDRRYVQNWSFWADLKIIARTFKVLITRDGAC